MSAFASIALAELSYLTQSPTAIPVAHGMSSITTLAEAGALTRVKSIVSVLALPVIPMLESEEVNVKVSVGLSATGLVPFGTEIVSKELVVAVGALIVKSTLFSGTLAEAEIVTFVPSMKFNSGSVPTSVPFKSTISPVAD